MKKLLSCILVICMVATIVSTGAFAAANPVVANYDTANTSLSVSADFGEVGADLVTTVSVYKYGNAVNDINLPLLFQTVFTNDKGVIDISLAIPAGFESDKYTVKVANERGSYDADFLYAKNSDIKAMMLLLNEATTVGEVKSIITSNYAKLALDEVLVSPYVDELSGAYFTICSNTDYTDEKVFYPDFMQCLAFAEIALGSDTATVLNNYKLYIGSEVESIKTYPSSVQTLLIDYISNSQYADGLLSEQLPLLRVLAFFKSSSTWGEAKLNILGTDSTGNQYIDNFAVLSPDTTYYSNVKNVNLVYEKLFTQRNSITTFAGLKSTFATVAKDVFESEKEPSGKTSFGGSSFPSATIVPGTTPGDVTPANPQMPSTSRFSDITDHWAKPYIEELSNTNVISGYPDGTFAPDKNVTRAEFAKMIMSYTGLEGASDEMNFEDVKSADWFYPYISGAVHNGLVNGISEMQFAPQKEITRQDVCVIIYRYLGNRISYEKTASFIDSILISDYALDAVSSLSQNGILTGYGDNSFKPQSFITRAETAVILSKVTEYLK